MAIVPPDIAIAIWVLTPNGLALADRLRSRWPSAVVRCSRTVPDKVTGQGIQPFDRLGDAVRQDFNRYRGHLFVMASGIVVRLIAPLLIHKTEDPAVVVMDDRGQFAVSLVSGHVGGANRLAREAAACIGAQPVITTATDVNHKPAADLLAVERGLLIENPEAIKTVNMALLADEPVNLYDPYGCLADANLNSRPADPVTLSAPGIYVDVACEDLPESVLVLRPPLLAAGIGCNRDTGKQEILDLVRQVLADNKLSINSLRTLATIDLKANEPGLVGAAADLGLPLAVYSKEQLREVDGIATPSRIVEKHVGVSNVCEAAAILATGRGTLIVSKRKSVNATVAIARAPSLS